MIITIIVVVTIIIIVITIIIMIIIISCYYIYICRTHMPFFHGARPEIFLCIVLA